MGLPFFTRNSESLAAPLSILTSEQIRALELGDDFHIVERAGDVAPLLLEGAHAVALRHGVVDQEAKETIAQLISEGPRIDIGPWDIFDETGIPGIRSALEHASRNVAVGDDAKQMALSKLCEEVLATVKIFKEIDLGARERGLVSPELALNELNFRLESRHGYKPTFSDRSGGFHVDILNQDKQYYPIRAVRSFVGPSTEFLKREDVENPGLGKLRIREGAVPLRFPDDAMVFFRGTRGFGDREGVWHRQPIYSGPRLFFAMNFAI